MQNQTSDNSFLDKLSFDNVMKINSIEDDNIHAEVVDAIENIPFLFNLTKKNRRKLSDYKRWDHPYNYDEREEDPNGRIEVNITEPHELVDMDYFRERALYFQKHGEYCDITPNRYPGSRYMRFWREEQRRCRDGYVRESDGEWITGYHYWYLNYSPIQITEDIKTNTKKKRSVTKMRKAERKRDFPKIWDSDYLWFHYIEKAEQNGNHVVNLKSRGRGYEQPYTSIIKTLNGDVTMGDIKVGDKVLTPSGEESAVLEKYEQGVKDVYQVTFSDDRVVECGLNHLWAVYKNYSPSRPKPYVVLTLEDIIKDGLYYDTKQGQKVYKYKLPEITPIDYEQKEELPIHPYILGALLGDGSMSTPSIKIASDDEEILQHFRDILGSDYVLNRDHTTNNNHLICYTPAKRMHKKFNPLKDAVIELGVNVSCKHKFIPEMYKRSSYETRILLVKGLMDTDGSANKNGGLEFTNTSEQLVDDLAEILRSLGIVCKKAYSERTGESVVTDKKYGTRIIKRGNIFRLYIKTNEKVFTLPRKLARMNKNMRRFTKPFIKNIKKVRQEESACILINNDEHVYLTDHYVPTHNSYKGGSSLTRNYYHFKGSNSVAIASSGDYLLGDGILNKSWDILNFIDNNTPWKKSRDYEDRKDHKKASYKDPKTKTEKGILSEIIGVTTGGDPERARGKRAKLVLFEESGKFPHFKTTVGIARPSVEQGNSVFGLIVAWGTGGCICAGTKVWTANGGLKNIEDLKAKDGIIGFDGKTYSIETIPEMESSIKDCVQITTNTRRTLRCSDDHPILKGIQPNKKSGNIVGNEYIAASELNIGDRIGTLKELNLFGDKKMWEPRVIGWLIGDGTYGESVKLSNCESEINDYMDSKFKGSISESYITKTGKNYRTKSVIGIVPKLKELGIYRQTKLNKTLPIDVHSYCKEDICELLGGFFDADGYVAIRTNKKRNTPIGEISISSMSESLLNEVRLLLQKLGIHGRMRKRLPRVKKKGIQDKNPWYEFTISSRDSMLNFAENIKLFPKVKQERLNKIKEVYKNRKSHMNHEGIVYESIVSIKDIGKQKIYNMHADNTNTYIANGIITHNTAGADFDGIKEAFYSPATFNMMGIPNVYDKKVAVGSQCGYYCGEYMNREGCYDKNGNSDVITALIETFSGRELIKKSSKDPNALTQEKADRSITPQEACMRKEGSLFNVEDLSIHLADVTVNPKQYTDASWKVKLTMNEGKVKWSLSDYHPVRQYPVVENKGLEGCVEIFEHPIERDGSVQPNIYVLGCLTPGEKVMTNAGLKNVEEVTLDDKLINDKGDLVKIFNLQQYDVLNETTYNLKISNTFRKTNFTSEHPILISKEKWGYNGKEKTKRGFPNKYRRFDFNYTTVDKVEKGNWIKVPNIYKKINTEFLNAWDDGNTRIDRLFENPLYDEDFWWFVGIWLGDGWNTKPSISVSFNKKEDYYIEKFINVIDKLFNRKVSVRERDNAVECTFTCKQLSDFLDCNFGKYAGGKYIPEDVKYLPIQLKKNLLLGYLDSDGAVTFNNKKYFNLEYVSINLELLESVQDIAFSLGIVSNLCKLRDASNSHVINGRKCVTQETYHLRFGHNATMQFNDLFDYKIGKLTTINSNIRVLTNRTKNGCYLSNDGDFIYFQVKDIETNVYSGPVYNFECDTHTFMCHHITTHNCDPYDDDIAGGPSLGSILVGNRLTRRIVAEYTGRPQTAEEFYEICYRLAKYYNGRINYENNKKGMFQYFDRIQSTYLLCDTPGILRDMEITKKIGFGNTSKGTNATKAVNNWGNSLIRSYLMEPAYGKEEGERNYRTIVSPGMLKELIAYDPEIGNYDRIAALRMLLIYMADLEKFGVTDLDDPENNSKKQIDPFFLRTRSSLNNKFVSSTNEFNHKRPIRQRTR